MEKGTKYISRLIAAKILGQELTGEERDYFDAWMKTSLENRRLFERVEGLEGTQKIIELEKENYGDKMVSLFMKKRDKLVRRNIRRRLYAWLGSAAAIVVATLMVLIFYKAGEGPLEQDVRLSRNDIVPGKVEAVLTLAGGETINITGELKEKELKERLIQELKTGDEKAYHTLTVPPGGEYFYELADGTKVWLNSQSELRFPASFDGERRQVFLAGEAFFDVVKNSEKPFIVSLSKGDITVYGTRFNVTDYEEAVLSTVLVEGSIGFESADGQNVRLVPSDRLVYEVETNTISVEKVDTMLYTAWINKMFIFNGQPLEAIMTTLSRWYDFDITFESEDIKGIRLSGRLNRYQDIRVLLNTYEEVANIKFKIEGRHITISRK
ncbi:MAG: DUF4974 domain-containing protein [Bacteroidales bacterium]|nr:DUF4974 domain-containing protein [Bacteroidales bacterium]